MDKEYFKKFVDECGGPTAAAKKLGVSVVLINHIKGGRRNVSSNLALAIEQKTNGKYSKSRLLWGNVAA